jgi:hypothetical protein
LFTGMVRPSRLALVPDLRDVLLGTRYIDEILVPARYRTGCTMDGDN